MPEPQGFLLRGRIRFKRGILMAEDEAGAEYVLAQLLREHGLLECKLIVVITPEAV